MQLKREAKLLTVIGLTTIYVVPNLFISKNDFTKMGTEVIASIYFLNLV